MHLATDPQDKSTSKTTKSSKKLGVSVRKLNSLKKRSTEPNEGLLTSVGRYTGQYVVYHKKQYRHGLGNGLRNLLC
jgi:hypothetical protein